MLEFLLSPRRAERKPVWMLVVGIFYGLVSLLLANWVFSKSVLDDYMGILVVTFVVMFTMPFMYYLLRHEEEKEIVYNGKFKIIKEHSKALLSLMWLFIGFIIAFSFWYIFTGNTYNFKAQIETYCYINHPSNFDLCAQEYGAGITGRFLSTERFLVIFLNNVYVLMFTLIFSLIFGAGAIFILAWNASVIAVAIGIFAKTDIKLWPMGIARYMIHGIPEIAAYFIGAIAGGMLSMAIVRQEFTKDRMKAIFHDFISLVLIAIIFLLIAGFIEVYIFSLF